MQVPERIVGFELNRLFELLGRLLVHAAQCITAAHAVYRQIVILIGQIGATEMFFRFIQLTFGQIRMPDP
jgi:hypothetical protein